MTTTHARVLQESLRFRQALPTLLPKYDGRWVIFLNGAVQADFDDEEEAYVAAVTRFGVHGGFVITRVAADVLDPIFAPSSLW